jgi:type IX secretion system PorP/SprF family membrane protein
MNIPKTVRKTLLIILLTGCCTFIQAQDAVYSYYYGSPLYFNPAQTGDFKGDWRITFNFRDESRMQDFPYNVMSASYDTKIYPFNNELGLGVLLMHSRYPNEDGVSLSGVMISTAYKLNIKNHLIRTGLQLGYREKSTSELSFSEDYDRSLAIYNSSPGLKIDQIDFNLGASWHYKFRKLEPKVGVGLFHLSRPQNTFFENDSKEPIRLTVSAQTKIDALEDISITPSIVVYSSSVFSSLSSGVNAFYKITQSGPLKGMLVGVNYKTDFESTINAYSLYAGARIRRIDLVLGYDLIIGSGNSSITNFGAFEINLIYKSISTVLNTYSIPCDRY